MKKALISALAALLLLASCGEKTPEYEEFYSYADTSTVQYENSLTAQTVVLKTDNAEITCAEFMYYLATEKEKLREGVWNAYSQEEKAEFVKSKVIPEIFFTRCAATLAQKYDISVSSDEYAEYEEYISDAKDSYAGKEGFDEYLNNQHMTYDLYRFLSLQGVLTSKVCEYYTSELTTPVHADDETLFEAVKNGEIIRVKHILIKNDVGDDEQENFAKAKELENRINEGEDFDKLVKEYSEDPELENEPDGYYIVKYEMEDAFTQAAFSLKVGETSGTVYVNAPSYSGYHIIKRYEPDDGYVDKNLSSLRSNYLAGKFYEEVYKMCDELNITYTEDYNKIEL